MDEVTMKRNEYKQEKEAKQKEPTTHTFPSIILCPLV